MSIFPSKLLSVLSPIKSFLFPPIAHVQANSPAEVEKVSSNERLSVFILSMEWILFGSLHFSAPEQTVHQIPDYFPSGRHEIAILTGMLEVTTGMLVLVPRTRRLAAVISLTLLALFIPAMFNILSNDSALPHLPWPWPMAFRIALMPNNIYLAILSIYLLNHSTASLVGVPRRRQPAPKQPAQANTWFFRVLVACLLLMANSAGFITLAGGLRGYFAQASLVAMMCIASGALIGFLFAVPRVNTSAKSRSYLLPNTNVETISDWITKTLVGVGLVNFGNIGAFLEQLSGRLAGSFQSTKEFMLALIVYFFAIGLMQGYLLTRMFLSWEFSSELNAAGYSDGPKT